ncbi:MAG: N-acetylneuraminate synthase [Candidatus Bathyarchaeia archaeon]
MENNVMIGGKRVGESVLIIAEAGVNHNGSLRRALKMVDEAAKAGADAIKFQTFVAERVVAKQAPKANYQKRRGRGKTQLEMLKPLELSRQDFVAISERARKRGIMMLSTPYDDESVDLLESLAVPAYKVASGDLTNTPLLEHIATKGKPVILSTGMATLEEIKAAVATIRHQGNDKIVLLHCVSSYPSKVAECNLRVMQLLRDNFKVPVGFSDHTMGTEVALAAAALGAVVIEKHFTLSRRLIGPDHRASLEVRQFREMVRGIRLVEEALGGPVKVPTKEELTMRLVARRSLVAAVEIPKDHVIAREMIAIKRPGTGISPSEIQKVLGKIARRAIKRDEVLTWHMVE